MRLVVLTKKMSYYGLNLLNAFQRAGIILSGVIVIEQTLKEKIKLFNSVRRRIGLRDTLYYSLELARSDFKNKQKYTLLNQNNFIPEYKKLAERVFYSRGTNSLSTIKALSHLNPEILILGQSGIVDRRILNIIKIGTLNAHPGILPYYRGVDVCAWALYYKDFHKIGYTVHWVDSGVDTGNIIARKFYVFRGDETIFDLEDRITEQSVVGMIAVVKDLSQNYSEGQKQEPNIGRQFFKIPLSYKRIAQCNLNLFLSKKFNNNVSNIV